MRYGKFLFGAITLLSATAISGTINTSLASSYVQYAQGTTMYGPDGQVYHIDENARRNNQVYGVEERRNRRIRRQIRRDTRARNRARNRAARKRLYDVRRQENGTYRQQYDAYGNPIQRRSNAPYPSYNQPRKTRERVKLVYVPIPRDKPYHLIGQTNAPKIIKTATAPVDQPEDLPKQTIEQGEDRGSDNVATLPKIEIETAPNPSSTKPTTEPKTPAVETPRVKTPIAKLPKQLEEKPQVTQPTIKQPTVKKVEPKQPITKTTKTTKTIETKKPQKKIKYTTFAETLRKIRDRNNAEKKAAPTTKTATETVEKPVAKKPIAKKAEAPKVETKPIKLKIKKVASLEPKKAAPKIEITTSKPVIEEPAPKPAANQISCKKAREIIVDYGFSDVKKITCKGKDYNFSAKRDGTPFKITLSALSGELTKVLRQK